MTLLNQIKDFVTGLILLVIWCLLMDHLVYWGLYSVVCFFLLWRLNRKCPENFSFQDKNEGWRPKRRKNPSTGLPMAGGVDVSGTLYGGSPQSGFIKFDNP